MPKVEHRWTFGNVLALFGMVLQVLVLGGGGVWYASGLEARVAQNDKATQQVQISATTAIEQIRRDVQSNSNRLQAVEMNYGRMDERLISMQSILVNIERKLEQIARP